MSTTIEPPTETKPSTERVADAMLEYVSIHTGAVLGLLVSIVSSVICFTAGSAGIETTVFLVPLPLIGLCVSLYAWRAISQAPDVYTGQKMAITGVVLSGLFLTYGLGYGLYVHATEVPDGYVRTSFLAMKPSANDLVDRVLIPEEVQEHIFNGEKVFIKGFIRPDSIKFKQNIDQFLLVRDNQECCFGDMAKVKYYDQVQVKLGTGLTTDFSRGLFRLGGQLKIGPGDPQLGTPMTYYLEADYVEP